MMMKNNKNLFCKESNWECIVHYTFTLCRKRARKDERGAMSDLKEANEEREECKSWTKEEKKKKDLQRLLMR